MDISILAGQIKRGNSSAFQLLFEKYSPRIYQLAQLWLKSPDEAEELVQDLFCRIWEKRNHLDQSKNLGAYIYKVAINMIYDLLRHKRVERSYLNFCAVRYEVHGNSTWHSVVYNEMITTLNGLVLKMPVERQKIFRLSRENGLTNDEIAVRLNLSKRTVENQLYRATEYLKKYYLQQYIVCSPDFN